MPLIYPRTTRQDFDRTIDPNDSCQVKLRPASNDRRRVLLPRGMGYGESPDEEITRAIQLGNIDRASEIFNSGCIEELDKCCNSNGRSLLHIAARNGDMRSLKWLRMKGIDFTAINEDSRDTALHLACFGGHLNTAKFILEDADVSSIKSWFVEVRNAHEGKTAGHIAVERGHTSLVRWLFEPSGANASIFREDDAGRSPIDLIRAGCGVPNQNRVTTTAAAESKTLFDRKVLQKYNKMSYGHISGESEKSLTSYFTQPSDRAFVAMHRQAEEDASASNSQQLSLRIWANLVAIYTYDTSEKAFIAANDLHTCVSTASAKLIKKEVMHGALNDEYFEKSVARWYNSSKLRSSPIKDIIFRIRHSIRIKKSY